MEKILLHSCCAPCSAAILEWMQNNGYCPTIFFYNPNIFPQEEYLKRKVEIVRYAASIGVPIVDMDYEKATDGEKLIDGVLNEEIGSAYREENGGEYEKWWLDAHLGWKKKVEHLSLEPERGARCLECFKIRLAETARYALENGFQMFCTSLVSSRWKDINQIFEAGRYAASLYPGVSFWEKNWRKGGLYERRNELARQFYNQKYCGCEFSLSNQSDNILHQVKG